MGFFSRLFQPRADGQPVTDDWTSLPDSQASELVLMDEEAVRLMAEFDIDSAIASHERWLPWLSQALQGAHDERLRPEVVRDDSCSELGQWLHGNGRIALGHFPAFDMLMRRNRYFHQQAAMMLLHAEALTFVHPHSGEQLRVTAPVDGEYARALALFDGPAPRAA